MSAATDSPDPERGGEIHMAADTADNLTNLAQGILGDVEKLIGQQFNLVRQEMKGELEKAATAGVSLGTGAGAAAVGGLLGTLAVVHFVHEVTGLPLWLSYALTGGALAATGCGLLSAGVGQASQINLLPGLTGDEGDGRSAGRRQTAAAPV
jgi:hypothetical protein